MSVHGHELQTFTRAGDRRRIFDPCQCAVGIDEYVADHLALGIIQSESNDMDTGVDRSARSTELRHGQSGRDRMSDLLGQGPA